MITLSTLAQASAQEVFDQAAAHMLTQNKKSYGIVSSEKSPGDIKSSCVYRSPEGLKCPAGCFIADDEYMPGFEGLRWANLIQSSIVIRLITGIPNVTHYGAVDIPHAALISDLQTVHDAYFTHEWRDYLSHVAKQHDLSDHVTRMFGEVYELTPTEVRKTSLVFDNSPKKMIVHKHAEQPHKSILGVPVDPLKEPATT